MSPLNNHQKHLLFDYCIGLTSKEETAEAEALISSNDEAAEIYSKLKAALSPLDSIQPQPCPDDLAERTIIRLNDLARASQIRLQKLLAGEQAKSVAIKGPFWRGLGKVGTAAAVFIIFLGALNASSNFARQRYYQNRCQAQMGNVFRGLGDYVADNDGKLPVVVTSAGSPWWMVGRPGEENFSNTRCMWRLVREDYVDPPNFVCPGRMQKRVIRFELLQVKKYKDFPGRQYITYSTKICCKEPTMEKLAQKILMADLSPLFEVLPSDFSEPLKIPVDEKLLNVNSINHNYRGQNILLGDGSIRFLKTRFYGITQDDIYTLKNILYYNGTERPSCEEDSFNAP
ncbi:MAG: hypothetical protein GWN67_18630 [Phycisphaerae bacterium]|nr:hypothetical protein [Phycisphaerae bacterium]NIP53897.1 hypothetical protein [Phycisphaerae bacterium]NIS53059.1 hypothetical protein [Phycisphaerae bacterium]NIU10580.1 hypothetical protein [Phycisphaerae bacterium]NIU58324.1 hypothetical protein [Phycisphaerae bacterium]